MAFLESPRPPVTLLSNMAQSFLRQYGKVPQILADNNIPAVSGSSNLGTGGGAGLSRALSNGSSGNIDVYLGRGFSQTLTISVTFPDTPPALFWSCDFGVFEVSTEDDLTYTLTFSSVTGIARSAPWHIHYEPSIAR